MDAMQTNLFESKPETQKKSATHYTVQKYRLTYVKERDYSCSVKIRNNRDVNSFCEQYLSHLPLEKAVIIALDSGNNIIGYDVFEGATNQCAVYPSNVFRFLLNSGAASFILAHNHPGGAMNPSAPDWAITKRLFDVGKLLDIPLFDHLIYSESGSISLRQYAQWPN